MLPHASVPLSEDFGCQPYLIKAILTRIEASGLPSCRGFVVVFGLK
jgi:hypothetical protein